MSIRMKLLAVVVSLACAHLSAMAMAAPAPVEPSPASAIDAQVRQWIEQLDGAEFTERQEASQKLSESGRSVFPELEKTVESGSREAAGRAIAILKRHFQRGDDETKQAAKASLTRLASSQNSAAAQRASDVLNPPKEPQLDPNVLMRGFPQVRAANLRIQIAAGGRGMVQRVQVARNANGQVEVEAEENGRKTKIRHAPGGKIEAEVTEKQNGKEVTRKIEAKDLNELKTKDADAARLFEKYFPPNGGRVAAPARAGEARQHLIKALDEQIERMKARAATDPNAQRIVETLEDHRRRLAPAEQEKEAGGR